MLKLLDILKYEITKRIIINNLGIPLNGIAEWVYCFGYQEIGDLAWVKYWSYDIG